MSSPNVTGPSRLARTLGYAGLMPFVGLAALIVATPTTRGPAALLLAGYAAVIASFLGGIHWGLVMRGATPSAPLLAWGVMPSLLAWPALLLPPHLGLTTLAGVLMLCLAADLRLYRALAIAKWLGLRWPLTLVAATSCLAAAAALWPR